MAGRAPGSRRDDRCPLNPQGTREWLADGSIAADERLAKVIGSGALPASVLLRFACDCAARALEREQEARREPEPSSLEAVRRTRQWLEGQWPWKPAPRDEKPSAGGFFSSITMADAMLERNLSPARLLAGIGVEARRAIESWEAKAPAAAAEAAAIVAEAAAEVAEADADAEHEWQAEESFTDVELLDAAMQAAAARGPGAWAAKSEMDAGAIAARWSARRKAAARRAGAEVSRLAAIRAAEDAATRGETAPREGHGGLGSWIRSLWTPRTPPDDSDAERARAAQARDEEYAWQISHLRGLLEQNATEA